MRVEAKYSILLQLISCLSTLFSQTNAHTSSEIWGDSVQEVYYESGPYGSRRGGEFFTDFWQSLDGRRIRPTHWPDQINIGAGGRIDSIQIFYGTYRGEKHGGDGGTLHKIRLFDGDKVVRVTGRSGIGNGNKHGPYGGTGGRYFNAKAPYVGCYLAFISGRAYLRLDTILFHWRCPATAFNPEPRLTVNSGAADIRTTTIGARVGAATRHGLIVTVLLCLVGPVLLA